MRLSTILSSVLSESIACRIVSYRLLSRIINTHKIGNTHGLESNTLGAASLARLTSGDRPGSSLAHLLEALLNQCLGINNLAVGVDIVQEAALSGCGIVRLEQSAMHSGFQLDGALRHPLDVSLGLALLVEHGL